MKGYKPQLVSCSRLDLLSLMLMPTLCEGYRYKPINGVLVDSNTATAR